TLEVVRIHDSAVSSQQGALLVNPGGPGASGLDLALGLVGELDPSILQNFDLVGFDPRGVGLSSPIECVSDQQKDQLNAASPDVRTMAGLTQAQELLQGIA